MKYLVTMLFILIFSQTFILAQESEAPEVILPVEDSHKYEFTDLIRQKQLEMNVYIVGNPGRAQW